MCARLCHWIHAQSFNTRSSSILNALISHARQFAASMRITIRPHFRFGCLPVALLGAPWLSVYQSLWSWTEPADKIGLVLLRVLTPLTCEGLLCLLVSISQHSSECFMMVYFYRFECSIMFLTDLLRGPVLLKLIYLGMCASCKPSIVVFQPLKHRPPKGCYCCKTGK